MQPAAAARPDRGIVLAGDQLAKQLLARPAVLIGDVDVGRRDCRVGDDVLDVRREVRRQLLSKNRCHVPVEVGVQRGEVTKQVLLGLADRILAEPIDERDGVGAALAIEAEDDVTRFAAHPLVPILQLAEQQAGCRRCGDPANRMQQPPANVGLLSLERGLQLRDGLAAQ